MWRRYVIDNVQKDTVEKIKLIISETPILSFFDLKKPTIFNADASSYVMGGVRFKNTKVYGWKKVLFFVLGHYLTRKKNYAQIKRENLSCVFTCENFSMHLVGLEFELQIDHKPLIPLINIKNVRVQRLLERLAGYSPTVKYVPGKYVGILCCVSQ